MFVWDVELRPKYTSPFSRTRTQGSPSPMWNSLSEPLAGLCVLLLVVILRIPLGCDWSAIGSTHKDVMWQASKTLLHLLFWRWIVFSTHSLWSTINSTNPSDSVCLSVRNWTGVVLFGLKTVEQFLTSFQLKFCIGRAKTRPMYVTATDLCQITSDANTK